MSKLFCLLLFRGANVSFKIRPIFRKGFVCRKADRKPQKRKEMEMLEKLSSISRPLNLFITRFSFYDIAPARPLRAPLGRIWQFRIYIWFCHYNKGFNFFLQLKTPQLLSRNGRKRTFWYVRPTKTQISLHSRAVWSEYSLSTWRNLVSLAIRNALSEDSDQTARMRRLIWIFVGRTCPEIRFWTFRLNYGLIKTTFSPVFIMSQECYNWINPDQIISKMIHICIFILNLSCYG